ncbi:unnamed protein product [Malus baccata var. baccata]
MADSGEVYGKKKVGVQSERYRWRQVLYFEGKNLDEAYAAFKYDIGNLVRRDCSAEFESWKRVHWDVDETDEKQRIYVDGLFKQRIMDKTWIQNPNKCADEYLDEIEDFIDFALRNGMIETYNNWNHHGEQLDNASSSNATRVDNVEPIVDPNEQVMDIINDVFPFASTKTNQEREDDVPTAKDSAEFEQYEKLLKNANQELYLRCKSFSVLMAIVELMHGKIKYHMSNQGFDYFLGVFKRMLPKDNCLPRDHRHAKRLQRLYMLTHIATDMRWHKEKRVEDDVMRHPADGKAWKEFD